MSPQPIPPEQTPIDLRIRGAFMIARGLIIVAACVALACLLLDIPIPPQWMPAGTRIDRGLGQDTTNLQKAGLAAIGLVLLVFGTASIVQGGLQLVTARRSKLFGRLMLVIALLFAVAGIVATAILGRMIWRGGP